MTRLAEGVAWLRTRLRRPPLTRLSDPAEDPVIDLLFAAAPIGCVLIDDAGRVLRTNIVLSTLLGREPSPGSDAALLFDSAGRDAMWQKLVPLLRGRPAAVQSVPARLAGPDEPPSVVVTADPIRNRAGIVTGALLRFADISRETRLEAQLAQSQKLQAVGQLAGGIAHDFNNLLTAILGAAEEIASRPGLDDETLADATHIQNGAERGAALVRQLLAFSRQQTLQPSALVVNDVITGMSGLLRRLLGETVRLELDLEQPSRAVWVDPVELDRVLVNLAVNARDAMGKGGVLTLRSGHLTLYQHRTNGAETIPPGRYVTIEVADTGTGIAADVLPRIFDPFFTTKKDRGGTGLGLATVHGIIRQSDGFLTVDSAPAEGTRFRIHLPRHDGPPAAAPGTTHAPTHAAPGAASGADRLVLLVEDEEPVRRLAIRSFERRGWTVLAAETGEAALTLLDAQHRPVTAVISDMVMPGMDGVALLRAVRARPGLESVPAIIVSGYAEEVLRREIGAVSTGFIAKPYLPKDLVARLEALLAETAPDHPRDRAPDRAAV